MNIRFDDIMEICCYCRTGEDKGTPYYICRITKRECSERVCPVWNKWIERDVKEQPKRTRFDRVHGE